VPANPKNDADEKGHREANLNGMQINVSNVARQDFDLFIKQPAFFTAALPVLTNSFSCFAIVQNPLAVMLSWRTAGMPVTHGRMPAAEMFNPDLKSLLEAEANVLERQFILLDFCFSMYRRFLPERTVKYEEIIKSGGAALSLVNPAAKQLREQLRSRNLLGIETDEAALEIGKRLLERPSPCWSFYERRDVEVLLSQTGARTR